MVVRLVGFCGVFMFESTVKFSSYLVYRRLWVCLYDDGSRRQARFSPNESVIFLRHA